VIVATANDPSKPAGEFRQHYRIKPLKAAARGLRKRQTKSEKLLWQALRSRKLDGLDPAAPLPAGLVPPSGGDGGGSF